ncbi:HtaA domain-containing protein [Cutibacterium acnes]
MQTRVNGRLHRVQCTGNSHFLNVLKVMMHGSWSTSSGASWDDKTFSFPASESSLSSTAQKADVQYSGSVHFTGVDGRMDLTLSLTLRLSLTMAMIM